MTRRLFVIRRQAFVSGMGAGFNVGLVLGLLIMWLAFR